MQDMGPTSAIVALVLAVTPFADDQFQCGSQVVELGMASAEVLEHCGKPIMKIVDVLDASPGSEETGKTEVRRWIYKSNGRTVVLTFEQDKVTAIDW
jgi:Protein of unknown function (DUF2845)